MRHIARFAMVAAAAVASIVPATASTAAGAQGTGVPSVAIVFPSRNVIDRDAREYDGLSKAVAALLAEELSANSGVRVIGREQVLPLLGSSLVDRETAMHVGALVGAQHTVYGGLTSDASGNLRVDVRAVNVTSGTVEYSDRLQDQGDNVVQLVHHLAGRLSAALRLPAVDAGASSRATVSLPLRSALQFGRALDLADKGDRAGARELLGALLRDHPDFAPARAAMSRLQ